MSCSTPGRTGQRQCHAKADAWLDDNIQSTSTRVEQLYDEYIESIKKTTSKSNWMPKASIGRTWIKPAIGQKKIADVTEQQLQEIINDAYHKKHLSKKTLMNIREAIAGFLKYCRKSKVCKLYIEELTIPKSAVKKDKNILQPEHLLILFQSDQTSYRGKRVTDPLIHAYRFQVLTGLRPGELIGLRWADIKGREVFVANAINDKNEQTRGKNENAKRHFFLTDAAFDELERQRNLDDDDERVFGDVIQQTYRKSWYRYCDANDIPHITPYEMRHTFVSVAKRLPEAQVKMLVGHSQNMDTFGVYGHEVDGELQQTAEQLGQIFSDLLQKKQPTL